SSARRRGPAPRRCPCSSEIDKKQKSGGFLRIIWAVCPGLAAFCQGSEKRSELFEPVTARHPSYELADLSLPLVQSAEGGWGYLVCDGDLRCRRACRAARDAKRFRKIFSRSRNRCVADLP